MPILFAAGCIGGLTGEQDPEECLVSLYRKAVDDARGGSMHLEDGFRAYEDEEWVTKPPGGRRRCSRPRPTWRRWDEHAKGDTERAKERYDRAQDALDRADQYRMRDVSVLEAEFGA